jgi:hypothetical protein
MTPPPPQPHASARRLYERLLVAFFALLLSLPLLQQLTGLPGDVPLMGTEKRMPKPDFSWAAWFDGDYAPRLEKWLTGNIGLRGFLVRLACQVNYSVFGKTGMSGGTEITLGRDHWLFETAYIKQAVRQPEMGLQKAVRFAEEAARLQSALHERGIAFLVVISPSKAEVMPEYLPPSVALAPKTDVTGYARVTAEMKKRQVAFLDGRKLFLDLKAGGESNLFPSAGTHWSHYSAWLAWQASAALLNGQVPDLDLQPQAIGSVVMHAPLGADDDLKQLLNLWSFEPGGPRPLPYPMVAPPPPVLRDRYKALVTGDSFSLTLIDAMARSGQFLQIDLLYYFKRRITYPAPSFNPAPDRLIAEPGINMGAIDWTDPDWDHLLENQKVVILAVNEIHLKDAGWGFMESLLQKLSSAAPPAGNTVRTTTGD